MASPQSDKRRGPPQLFYSPVFGIDIVSSLVRFIVPLLLLGAVFYIFRLFGFGWRIYKPAMSKRGPVQEQDSLMREIGMIRAERYLPYVDAIGRALEGHYVAESEFRRLRREFVALSGEGIRPNDKAAASDMDYVVAQIVRLYMEETGREGLSLSSGKVF